MKRFTIKRIATNYGTKACRIDIRKHNYYVNQLRILDMKGTTTVKEEISDLEENTIYTHI